MPHEICMQQARRYHDATAYKLAFIAGMFCDVGSVMQCSCDPRIYLSHAYSCFHCQESEHNMRTDPYRCSYMPLCLKVSCSHCTLVSFLCLCQPLHSHHSATVFLSLFKVQCEMQWISQLMNYVDMEIFREGKIQHCALAGSICFSPAEALYFIFHLMCRPRRKLWPLVQETGRLQGVLFHTPSQILPKLAFLRNQSYFWETQSAIDSNSD